MPRAEARGSLLYAITNPNFIPERYPKVSGLFSGLDRGRYLELTTEVVLEPISAWGP